MRLVLQMDATFRPNQAIGCPWCTSRRCDCSFTSVAVPPHAVPHDIDGKILCCMLSIAERSGGGRGGGWLW